MQIYKIFDKVFRCEFRLFIGDLEEFKKQSGAWRDIRETTRSLRL